MSVGTNRVYVASMASGATLSTLVNFGKAFKSVYLQVPSMISSSQLYLQAAATVSGTYVRVAYVQANTSTIGHNTFTVGSGATGHIVAVPAGLQYMKVETTATCDSGETFTFICQDN